MDDILNVFQDFLLLTSDDRELQWSREKTGKGFFLLLTTNYKSYTKLRRKLRELFKVKLKFKRIIQS